MKKSVLLLVLLCFGTFVGYAEDTLSHTDFVGFEGVELSFEEAKLVTGGETYVFYQHVTFGQYHTGIVQTDLPVSNPKPKVTNVIEYVPKNAFSTKASSSTGFGNNVKHEDYERERKVKVQDNPSHYDLQEVERPEGKTLAEFDEDIRKAAVVYEKRPKRKYKVRKNSCNTATSTIIKIANGKLKPKHSTPGWVSTY